MKNYFGTDGIRNNHNFFIENNFALNLGKALGMLKYDNIYIGYDTRFSSQTITYYLISGLLASGKNIYLLDIASTPCIQYYTCLNNTLGISVTASHNDFLDNGIKIFINGEKINEELKIIIEKNLNYVLNDKSKIDLKYYGKLHKQNIFKYLEYLKKKKTNTKYMLLDTANGSGSYIGQYVFDNLINNKPNGFNINNNCGSTNISNLKNYLHQYNYIFSLDGDADRIIIMDHFENIYTGDIILYIINKYLVKSNQVVLSKITNKGVIELFEKNNVKVYLSDIGDSSLYEEMKKTNSIIGAEPSGHIINLQNSNFGDGIKNAIDVVDIINKYNLDLNKIYSLINFYPELSINLKNLTNENIEKIKDILDSQNNIDYIFRKSGTENVHRLYVTSKNKEILNNIKLEIDKVLGYE